MIPPNTTLSIVASNEAGISIAVKRIIDPKLPLDYRMGQDDLVLPGPVWKGQMAVKVYVDESAQGKPRPTDPGGLGGTYRGLVYSGEHNVNIVIDRDYATVISAARKVGAASPP
jgi:hypothetical protein